MNFFKKGSFLAVLLLTCFIGFGQLNAAVTYSIGPCDEALYQYIWPCNPNCNHATTMFTCTDSESNEVPIYQQLPDCDDYACIFI